jgi:8-amino-7-oxononanoate synthase
MVNRLEQQLQKRKDTGKLRALQPLNYGIPLIDFSSNDYLGLSRSAKLNDRIDEDWRSYKLKQPPGTPHLGSTGSRLLTGNSAAYQETEKYLASFHGHSQCLLANSGWDLNYGLLSCIPCSNTVVFYDELSHNSLIMGLQSGRGLRNVSFKHNDMNELRNLLSDLSRDDEDNCREKLIVVESIYSMDGDTCPIIELLEIAKEFNAMVVVDEAHSTGIIGSRGEGLVSSLSLQSHRNLLGKLST